MTTQPPNQALAATPAGETPLLLRALAGETLRRPPVWFMRQAGRYLPEYRAIREKVSFLELCADPDLCCEVTLQPLRRYPFDAGIIFSDILLIPEKMGLHLEFTKGMGPRYHNPVRSRSDIEALGSFDPVRDLPSPLRAIELTTAAAGVPILGFCGAPFTLACYSVEGGGSKNWIALKQLMYTDPDAFTLLLDKLAEAVGDHLQAQVEAGAAAVQLFDTWAGALRPEDWRRFALPAARKALSKVKGVPTLYFTKDTAPFLPWLKEVGATAYGVDWRVPMDRARAELGAEVPVQGNLDPIALFAAKETLAEHVRDVLRKAGPRGHIFNLGHGITPKTPLEAVDTVLETVHAWGEDQ
jgi:uroporphyrinogen decarboxylase